MARSGGVAIVGVLFLVGTGINEFGVTLFWSLVGAGFLGIFVLTYLFMEKCPSCNSRGTLNYVHRRKDGQPDGRYKINPIRCSRCGEYKKPT